MGTANAIVALDSNNVKYHTFLYYNNYVHSIISPDRGVGVEVVLPCGVSCPLVRLLIYIELKLIARLSVKTCHLIFSR